MNVREIAAEIVRREGGYVNDPADPGGPTKHGVTLGTMRRLGLDLDRNGRIDSADVKLITEAQAVEIYLQHYFRAPRINELPEAIQASVFDMYVNAGSNAIVILQRLLNRMGFQAGEEDGVLGPKTIRAASEAYAAAAPYLNDAYAVARRNYYFALADGRPSSRKYCVTRAGGKGGWITRAEAFMAPRYRMTDAEFRGRISKWA